MAVGLAEWVTERTQIETPVQIAVFSPRADLDRDMAWLAFFAQAVPRAVFAEAASEIAALIADARPLGRAELFQSSSTPLFTFEELRAHQDAALRDAGFAIKDGALVYPFLDGEIRLSVDLSLIAEGSALFSGKIRIEIADVGDVFKATLAGIFAVMLTAGSTEGDIVFSDHDGPIYVCHANFDTPTRSEEILQEAATDLQMQTSKPAAEDAARVRRWQLCLARAGFDPGPIDGVYGPRTEAAAQDMATAMGWSGPDWGSRVFVWDLMLHTSGRRKAELRSPRRR